MLYVYEHGYILRFVLVEFYSYESEQKFQWSAMILDECFLCFFCLIISGIPIDL